VKFKSERDILVKHKRGEPGVATRIIGASSGYSSPWLYQLTVTGTDLDITVRKL